MTRRELLGRAANGIGVAALASLLGPMRAAAAAAPAGIPGAGSVPGPGSLPHFAPTARHVIYLHQSGAPSQIDLFDRKPGLERWRGTELPDSVRQGQRVTGMTADAPQLIMPGAFPFRRAGRCGAWVSSVMPHFARIVDDVCIVHSMHTEAINHAPAVTFLQTGAQIPGRPSMGAWCAYGLGSASRNLPAFVVMTSRDIERTCGQPLYEHLWGSGFLPSEHQGVKLRKGASPVLALADPAGMSRDMRRGMLDDLAALNRLHHAETQDPEVLARIEQYEMAFRMQASVPELTDLSDEPEEVFELYGDAARRPGSYAWNCLMSRRLIERGVRFVQLYHVGWDQHNHLRAQLQVQCGHTDQPSAALVLDLKRRGLLDETLVVWGGEFGRGVACQGGLDDPTYGRDHHPRCFTIWMAGGGVRAGIAYGRTDDHSFNVVEDPVHVHDLQATILRALGVDHERLVYRHQGRDFRLTDVHGRVVEGVLS